jgi:hypothetical protein
VNTIRQIAAVAVVSGVAVASLTAPAAASKAPAKSTPKADPTVAAASYLVSQLGGKNHDHYSETLSGTSYPQYGETADAVLSLDAAGVGQKAAKAATKYLKKSVDDYLTGGGYTPGQYYPGSAAKLLLLADAQGLGYANFGGQNLLEDIVGDEGANGVTGEYGNPGDTKYSSSVTNQSLAILALAITPHASGPSDHAVSFLLGQQCSNGSFQNKIRADTTVACKAKKVDVDATAYAVQALENSNQHSAAKQAVKWLLSEEKKNGGWNETSGEADANSTAIAVEALISAGKAKAAKAGEAYLVNAQLGCSAKKAQRGAVINPGKYDALTAVFATSQAGVALAGKDLAGISNKKATAATPVLSCKK